MEPADITATLTERGNRYGTFDSNAALSQTLKQTLHTAPNWNSLPNYMKEALEMVMHKISRLLNGDFTYTDNVIDILGYTQLMLDEMNRENAKREMD